MAVDVSTGTTITFGTSGFSAEITDIGRLGPLERGFVETFHQGTTVAQTFKPKKLYNPGEISFEINFDPTDAIPPINSAAEAITIDWGGVGGTSQWIGSGFFTSFEITGELEEKMVASVTVKATGAWSKGGP